MSTNDLNEKLSGPKGCAIFKGKGSGRASREDKKNFLSARIPGTDCSSRKVLPGSQGKVGGGPTSRDRVLKGLLLLEQAQRGKCLYPRKKQFRPTRNGSGCFGRRENEKLTEALVERFVWCAERGV